MGTDFRKVNPFHTTIVREIFAQRLLEQNDDDIVVIRILRIVLGQDPAAWNIPLVSLLVRQAGHDALISRVIFFRRENNVSREERAVIPALLSRHR